jgi:hypothetical protein
MEPALLVTTIITAEQITRVAESVPAVHILQMLAVMLM